MTHRRTSATLLLAVLLAAILGACSTSSGGSTSPPASDAGPPKPGGTLTVVLPAATDGWNPSASQWAEPAFYVAQAIFDPLAAIGADNKVHPYLAQSITSNSNFTQWTIKLRPGIAFSDGEPLNADAVVLLLTKDKSSAIVGQSMAPVKTITKGDDLTVLVTTDTPWSAFPSFLATQAGYVAAPAQLDAKGDDATNKPIGTGPYVLKEWVKGDHLTVVKNPNYWRKGLPYLDGITFKIITDAQARLNALLSGQVDFAFDSTPSSIVQAKTDTSLTVREQDLDQPLMVMLNTAVAPLDDLRVRRALADATDVQTIIQRVFQGMSKQADGPYLPSSPWYSPSGYPMKPDIDKAKSLLASYKKDHGISGDLDITIEYTDSPTNEQMTQLLEAQWASVGVKLDRETVEQTTNINDFLQGKYQADIISYLGSLDPDIDSYLLLSTNANPPGSFAINFSRVKDPAIDQAFLDARKTDVQADRKAQYAIVWKQLAEKVPYLWIAHEHQAIMYRDGVHGLTDFTLPDGTKGSDQANFGVTPLLTVWKG
jgi:ABC-type transport system substrate-binding protein